MGGSGLLSFYFLNIVGDLEDSEEASDLLQKSMTSLEITNYSVSLCDTDETAAKHLG